MSKKRNVMSKDWHKGFITDDVSKHPDNLTCMKHAYDNVCKLHDDLDKAYNRQQSRCFETCKWVGAFYIALMGLLKATALTMPWVILTVGVPILLAWIFGLYWGNKIAPQGNYPNNLLHPKMIGDSEGLFLYRWMVDKNDTLYEVANTVDSLSNQYKTACIILFALVFLVLGLVLG
jgi:hypothetical protein